MSATLQDGLWERRRRSFHQFFVDAWPHIPGETGNPLVEHWSIKVVCDRFQRLIRGKLDKNSLIVNIPPGLGKSTIASVALPAWVWTWWPEWSTLMISGAEDIALRDSMKCRELIRSEWYQSSQPTWKMMDSQDGKEWFKNTAGGERQASTIGSKVTGKRLHHVGLDDPNETKDISESKLQSVSDAWDYGIANRLKDMRTGTVGLIQQRIHMKDLTGHILETDAEYWHHLIIRQEFEAGDQDAAPEDPRTENGQLLFPERFPDWVIAREKARLQSFGFAGQHQQRPIPRKGGLWKTDLIEVHECAPVGLTECRGWDVGASEGKGDYTVGARLGRASDGSYWIVDIARRQTGEPRAMAKQVAAMDGRSVVISWPQDPGQAGKDQAQSMVRDFAGWIFRTSPETGAKATRWEPFQAQVNGGNVRMVRGPGNAALLDEMRTNGQVHNDQLDALARAFSVIAINTGSAALDWVRSMADETAAADPAGKAAAVLQAWKDAGLGS